MKVKLILGVILCSAVAAVAFMGSGWGTSATVTTTAVQFTGFSAASVSVYNAGVSNVVYAMVNCSTNEFATAVAATNAVPIPPGTTFVFDTKARTSLHNISLVAAEGDSLVYVGAY